MKRRFATAFAFFLCIVFVADAAADGGEARAAKPRPKIGLVLEGGGALGFAHVGVLKVIEANRIPVDVVAGTSIGSIVGAGYASGLSVSEMEKAMTETDWEDLFGERVQRGGLTYRLKSGRGRELYGDAKLSIENGELATPTGLIMGQNILPLFQKLFGNLPTPCDFDSLPLPFRAIAADLETGKAYVPSSGNLAAIVRASMSVPGAFSPVKMDGRQLVDGGIVNNFPVDVAREMGADVLIAVALDDELAKGDKLNSLFSISGQMVSLLLAQNSDRSRATLGPRDVLVAIDLRGYTVTDFPKARELMAKGEEAGQAAVEALRRYAVSEEEYRRYQEKRTRKPAPPLHIDFVRVKNDSDVSDEKILKQIRLKAGDTFDAGQVEEDVQKVFGTGYFTSVRYNLLKEEGQTGVEIEASGKVWLHKFVRLGISLEDNFEGDGAFRLGAAYREYNLTIPGSYGELQFEVGKSPRVGAELYQPFDRDSAYFVLPQLTYGRNTLDVRQGGESLAQYNRTEGAASFFVGRDLETYGETMIGITRGFGELERDIGEPSLPEFDYDTGEAVFRLDIDKLDTPDFPTSGYGGGLRFISSLEDLGASDSFDTLIANAALPITWGRTTLVLRGDAAITFDERPVERSFGLGGFFDVSGFQQNSITASDYTQARALLFHRFSEVENPIFKLGFYVGSSLEFTSVRSDIEAIPDLKSIFSGSIFVGADTPLLPTYLGFGLSDESEHSFYLAIGRIGQSRR